MMDNRILIIAALLGTAACAEAATPVCEPLVPDVPVATNADAEIRADIELVELWRRGGTAEGEVLGLPMTIVPAPGGRIAIPDFQLGEVIVIAADGTWRGAITRAGDGPGEVRVPLAVAWSPDHVLNVLDVGNGGIVRLREDGSQAVEDTPLDAAFAAGILARGELDGAMMHGPDAPIVLTRIDERRADGSFTDRTRSVALRLDNTTARVDTLVSATIPLVFVPGWGDVAAPVWPRAVAGVADTLLATAAADGSYRVLLHDAAGRPVRQVCRAVEPLPVSDAEVGETTDPSQAALVEALRMAPRPDRPASIGRLIVAQDGGIWIERERPGMGSMNERLWGVAGAALDIFDPAGRYIGTIEQPARTRIQAVSGDVAWAFEVGELDEIEVVAYRIVRR